MAPQLQNRVIGPRSLGLNQVDSCAWQKPCCNFRLHRINDQEEERDQKKIRRVFGLKECPGAREIKPRDIRCCEGNAEFGSPNLQVGGMQKVFKHLFGVREKERLIKASQCYLSTTAGPIAGVLFVSMKKVAFCSERTIKLS